MEYKIKLSIRSWGTRQMHVQDVTSLQPIHDSLSRLGSIQNFSAEDQPRARLLSETLPVGLLEQQVASLRQPCLARPAHGQY